MRALALGCLLLCDCTLLFNPDNVPLKCDGAPQGPLGPIDAISGAGVDLTYEWPARPDAGDITAYRLCWGTDSSANARCEDFKVGTTCDSTRCSATVDGTDAGFHYNQRVFATVTSVNTCNVVSASGASLAVDTTPLNGDFKTLEGLTLTTSCDDAGIRNDGGEGLVFEQNVTGLFKLCVSTVTMGDEAWGTSRIDVDTQYSGYAIGGIVERVAAAATGQRTAILGTSAAGVTAGILLTTRPATFEVPVATSIAPFVEANWRTLEVSTVGSSVSVATGESTQSLSEVLRWSGTQGNAGQLGLALAAYTPFGTVDVATRFRNLRVHTLATIPDGGSTQQQWNFVGTQPLAGFRLSPGGTAAVSCPSDFVAAAGCASCTPQSTGCLKIDGNAGAGWASFDVPLGIDETQPWTLKFKFGATRAMASNNATILRSNVAPSDANVYTAFGGQALLDVKGGSWALGPLRAFGEDSETLGGMIAPGEWNAFTLHFNATAGTYSFEWNAALGRDGGYPPNVASHLGALTFGGAGDMHGYFTDVQISQP